MFASVTVAVARARPNRKGTPARTIHSLIYSVIEATGEEVAAAARKIREAEAGLSGLSGFERTAAAAGIEASRYPVPRRSQPLCRHAQFPGGHPSIAFLVRRSIGSMQRSGEEGTRHAGTIDPASAHARPDRHLIRGAIREALNELAEIDVVSEPETEGDADPEAQC